MFIQGKRINFRYVEPEDAEFILELRTNEKKCHFISQVDNDIEMQIDWINKYKIREGRSEEYYFIIEDKNKEKFGCVRIYDFIGDSFCWGSWIIKEGSPSYMAIESALLVYEFAFYSLNFINCHFDVRKGNEKVIAFHERLGAKIVDEDELNFYFKYTKESYNDIKIRYIKYLPTGENYVSSAMQNH